LRYFFSFLVIFFFPLEMESRNAKFNSFKHLYGAFYHEFRPYLNVFRRALSAWKKIEKFLYNNNGRHILETLTNGLSEKDILQFETKTGFTMTSEEKILYHLCGGQTSHRNEELRMIAGLLGGYKFYE
jgi:hypothetical protein